MKKLVLILALICLMLADGRAEMHGYFSYVRDAAYYLPGEPGVNPFPFQNVDVASICDPADAALRAQQECTIEYDAVDVYYDPETGMWQVLFYEDAEEGMLVLGGGQSVYLDGDGITRLIVYGE